MRLEAPIAGFVCAMVMADVVLTLIFCMCFEEDDTHGCRGRERLGPRLESNVNVDKLRVLGLKGGKQKTSCCAVPYTMENRPVQTGNDNALASRDAM